MKIGAFDDLDFLASCSGDGVRHFRPLISGVGEYSVDEGKAPSHISQQIACAVTILNIGRQNAHAEQETEVDEDMALATGDFLARVKPLWVER